MFILQTIQWIFITYYTMFVGRSFSSVLSRVEIANYVLQIMGMKRGWNVSILSYFDKIIKIESFLWKYMRFWSYFYLIAANENACMLSPSFAPWSSRRSSRKSGNRTAIEISEGSFTSQINSQSLRLSPYYRPLFVKLCRRRMYTIRKASSTKHPSMEQTRKNIVRLLSQCCWCYCESRVMNSSVKTQVTVIQFLKRPSQRLYQRKRRLNPGRKLPRSHVHCRFHVHERPKDGIQWLQVHSIPDIFVCAVARRPAQPSHLHVVRQHVYTPCRERLCAGRPTFYQWLSMKVFFVLNIGTLNFGDILFDIQMSKLYLRYEQCDHVIKVVDFFVRIV